MKATWSCTRKKKVLCSAPVSFAAASVSSVIGMHDVAEVLPTALALHVHIERGLVDSIIGNDTGRHAKGHGMACIRYRSIIQCT